MISNPSIGIVVVATNAYFLLGLRLIKSFSKHYKGDRTITFILFSDRCPDPYICIPEEIHHCYVNHSDFVEATSSKFECILEYKPILNKNFSHIYYIDADTHIGRDFSDDFFLGNTVALKHFMNDGAMAETKNYDRNPRSAAYIPHDTNLPQTYYHACFWGGSTHNVLSMCETLIASQQADGLIDYVPVWHDESYVNHYFHYNPPSKVLEPYDEFEFTFSDKANLNIDRDPNFNISHYLLAIARNRPASFQLDSDGAISFQEPVEPRVNTSTEFQCSVTGQLLRPAVDATMVELEGTCKLEIPGSDRNIELNETALLIWRLCDGTRDAGDIIQLLLESFPEEAEDILLDVPATLDNLFANGAIVQAPVDVD